MSSAIIIDVTRETPNIDAILIGITHVHASCIQYDDTEVTFLPPLSYKAMLQWWYKRFEDVAENNRHIWVELQTVSSRKAQLESPFRPEEIKTIKLDEYPNQEFEVAGLVSLNKPVPETASHRGEIEKLLISPNHRYKGMARRLMDELERVSLAEGRWSMALGTVVGSPAEQVYRHFGYTLTGVIPEHGYGPVTDPVTGQVSIKLNDVVLFHKKLKLGGLGGISTFQI